MSESIRFIDYLSIIRTDHDVNDEVTKKLYESLRSVAESYQIALATFPAGTSRDVLSGCFIGTGAQCTEALTGYKVQILKSRTTKGAIGITAFSEIPSI